MALTAEQWQAEIPSDVGQANNLTLTGKVATWWSMNSDRGYDLKIQYLYTVRKAIMWLLGQDWQLFDWAEGDVQKKESQKVKNLLEMLKLVDEDIKACEADASAPISFSKILAGGRDDPEVVSGKVDTYIHTDPDPVWDTP